MPPSVPHDAAARTDPLYSESGSEDRIREGAAPRERRDETGAHPSLLHELHQMAHVGMHAGAALLSKNRSDDDYSVTTIEEAVGSEAGTVAHQ